RSFGVGLTYARLLLLASRVAAWLQQVGLKKGDRVAIMMPNVLAYPVCLYGALLGGYCVVGINPLYTPREAAYQLEDSGARVLFVLEPFAHVVAGAMANAPLSLVVVVRPGALLGPKRPLINFVMRYLKRAVPTWNIPGHVRFEDVLRIGAGHAPQRISV